MAAQVTGFLPPMLRPGLSYCVVPPSLAHVGIWGVDKWIGEMISVCSSRKNQPTTFFSDVICVTVCLFHPKFQICLPKTIHNIFQLLKICRICKETSFSIPVTGILCFFSWSVLLEVYPPYYNVFK